jgi:hypothetical protein
VVKQAAGTILLFNLGIHMGLCGSVGLKIDFLPSPFQLIFLKHTRLLLRERSLKLVMGQVKAILTEFI